jgi:type II secretory pathway pseudopilin PulG
MKSERGHTLAEMVVVLALAGLLAGTAVPSLSGLRERARMRGAVRELATLMRTLRSRSIAEGRSLALVFDRDGQGWRYRLYADGDGDGVRTSDIADGTDPPLGAHARIGSRWGGVEFGFLPLPRVRKIPPSTGWLASLDDPVQIGATDVLSFSPRGDATSGSLFLADARSQMAAIVLFGPTVRVRLYRYDATLEEWVS